MYHNIQYPFAILSRLFPISCLRCPSFSCDWLDVPETQARRSLVQAGGAHPRPPRSRCAPTTMAEKFIAHWFPKKHNVSPASTRQASERETDRPAKRTGNQPPASCWSGGQASRKETLCLHRSMLTRVLLLSSCVPGPSAFSIGVSAWPGGDRDVRLVCRHLRPDQDRRRQPAAGEEGQGRSDAHTDGPAEAHGASSGVRRRPVGGMGIARMTTCFQRRSNGVENATGERWIPRQRALDYLRSRGHPRLLRASC